MSSDLVWLLTRNSHSRIVKRPNTGAPTLSFEKGNLRNISTKRNSGYANERTVDIRPGKSSESLVLTKRKTKNVNPRGIASAYNKSNIRARSGPRRTAGVVANQVAPYRPDLLKPALARSNRLTLTSSKKPEPVQQKPVRGRKGKAVRADDMDVDVD